MSISTILSSILNLFSLPIYISYTDTLALLHIGEFDATKMSDPCPWILDYRNLFCTVETPFLVEALCFSGDGRYD